MKKTTPGQHVKNRQQASNFKYAMKEEKIMNHSLTLWKSVRKSYWTKLLDKDLAFVRDVSASPEYSLFVATKQFIVIERFGINTEH